MRRRAMKDMTVEEFDAWADRCARDERIARASDEEGGPRLSLVPVSDRDIAWPTDLLAPATKSGGEADPREPSGPAPAAPYWSDGREPAPPVPASHRSARGGAKKRGGVVSHLSSFARRPMADAGPFASARTPDPAPAGFGNHGSTQKGDRQARHNGNIGDHSPLRARQRAHPRGMRWPP